VTALASTDPRTICFHLLRRVERHGAYSSLLLQKLEGTGEDPRDRALTHELVLGVLRRTHSLDAVIEAFSSRPLPRIHDDVRLILRIGLYQILFLDRIPPHAAVNESVRMARDLAGAAPGADRFVNALLRHVLRDRARASAAAAGATRSDPAEVLSVAGSHPVWLVRRWMARFGERAAVSLMEAQNRPAPLAARVIGGAARVAAAREALAAESIPSEPSAVLDDFLRLHGVAQHSDLFRAGGLYIQDEASGLVSRLAGVRPGDRVLDACAAPGGKTFAMAERAVESGWVLGADRHPARVGLLASNAARLHASVSALAADLSAGHPFREGTLFDVVVVDAPCSGTGVIRRSPELRDRVSEPVLSRLNALQDALLRHAATLVRPGGALVYSVCSLETEEADDRIAAFLAEHRFDVDDPAPHLPPAARALVDASGGRPALRTRPDRDDLDGFFAVRMIRQGA
jgi:16S rRNA (cytosine967-C5)-methyltransferase